MMPRFLQSEVRGGNSPPALVWIVIILLLKNRSVNVMKVVKIEWTSDLFLRA